MTSLAEILNQKRIVSRRKITDDVINTVIESLKNKMNAVAEKGEHFGVICVIDECLKLEKFKFDLDLYGKKRYAFHYSNGSWNWWGFKRKSCDHVCHWILQTIISKGIFKGIKIGMSQKYNYWIMFRL
jgi:hypothetical protein